MKILQYPVIPSNAPARLGTGQVKRRVSLEVAAARVTPGRDQRLCWARMSPDRRQVQRPVFGVVFQSLFLDFTYSNEETVVVPKGLRLGGASADYYHINNVSKSDYTKESPENTRVSEEHKSRATIATILHLKC